MNKPKCTAVIVAAGRGRRMGGETKKQYLELDGKIILEHTLERFQKAPGVDAMVLVLGEDELLLGRKLQKAYPKVTTVVKGGKERANSVYNGLVAVPKNTQIVLIHDGVRPFISQKDIAGVIENTLIHGACVLGVRAKDTIKQTDTEGKILATPNRDSLWQAQTPQGFRYDLIVKGYGNITSRVTDDSSVLELLDIPVYMLPGSEENIKITTPWDLKIGKLILEEGGNL